MGSNPAPSTFFSLSSSFFCPFLQLEVVLGQISPPAPTPPLFIILIFLNILQYLYVHLTISSILGFHPLYCTSPASPNLATNQPPPPIPDRTPTDFFCILTITSILRTLTPVPLDRSPPLTGTPLTPTGPPHPQPAPHPTDNPQPTTPLRPDPPPPNFFLISKKTSILHSHPP